MTTQSRKRTTPVRKAEARVSKDTARISTAEERSRILKDLEYLPVLLRRNRKTCVIGFDCTGDDIYVYEFKRSYRDSGEDPLRGKIARLTRLQGNKEQWEISHFKSQMWQRLPEKGNLLWCMEFIAKDPYHLFFMM